MKFYKIILKLTGAQVKYLYRLCLREYERINNKYYEYFPQKRGDLNQIGYLIDQLRESIIEIENDLGVRI